MICTMLTGCVGVESNFKINEDGTGTVSIFSGMTKESLEILASMDETEPINYEEYDNIVINGKTYYGEITTAEIENLSDLSEIEMDEFTGGVDAGALTIKQNKDGSFGLELIINPETGDNNMDEAFEDESEYIDAGIDVETLKLLMEDFVVIYNFEFPSTIKQVSGRTEGIKIDKNKLSINLTELYEVKHPDEFNSSVAYKFTTGNPKDVIIFTDVNPDFWGYKAIMALGDGGLVAGIGDNKFAPNSSINYAQFCQVLARALNLETGTLNNYWAYKAIETCVESGYVKDLGEINSKNYDIPMPREAAIAAMSRANIAVNGKQEPPNKIVKENDIPDFNTITDEYKEDVLYAYQFNITNGVDNKNTFSPKSELTRAQICQLFYNLGWTSTIESGNK